MAMDKISMTFLIETKNYEQNFKFNVYDWWIFLSFAQRWHLRFVKEDK